MKILHVLAGDPASGANRGALALVALQREAGWEVEVLNLRHLEGPLQRLLALAQRRFNALLKRLARPRGYFNFFLPFPASKLPFHRYDVLHLHWVAGQVSPTLLRQGRGAALRDGDALASAEALAVARVDTGQRDTHIQLALPISRQRVDALARREGSWAEHVAWDPSLERIRATRRLKLGELVITEETQPSPSPDRCQTLLLDRFHEGGTLEQLPWTERCEQLRRRLVLAGASTSLRPIRAYPELIVRAIVSPGVETMMENLFTHHGDHSQRYDLPVDGLRWADLVAGLIQADLGTALAYADDAGEVVCNPPSDTRVHGTGLIVMVRANQEPTPTRIRECLAAIAAQSPHATTAPGT